jgi:hypothetical protein
LAFIHIPKEKEQMVDYRATAGIFVVYSISTKQYFVYDPLARTINRSRDVGFREEKRCTVPIAADEAILNVHFYRDDMEEPKPTEKQPTRDESSEHQMVESLDDSRPDPTKPKKNSRELAGIVSSGGDAWKLLPKESCRNRAGKDTLAESAQLALKDEEFQDVIPICIAPAITMIMWMASRI